MRIAKRSYTESTGWDCGCDIHGVLEHRVFLSDDAADDSGRDELHRCCTRRSDDTFSSVVLLSKVRWGTLVYGTCS